MAFDLADLENETKETTAKSGSFETTFTYRPGVVTPKWAMKINKAENEGDTSVLVIGLVDMLVGWDITEKGKKLPIEEASVERLPMPLIGEIYRKAFTDQNEEAEETKNA